MSAVVDRVALAMANYDADQVDVPRITSVGEFRFDADRDEYLRRAREAIAAMREPTEAMIDVGTDNNAAIMHNLKGSGWRSITAAIYTAMIDSALSEREKGNG